MTSKQLSDLVAETPQELIRAKKPKVDDFTQVDEDGAKTVNTDDFKQALADWADKEQEFIRDPQYIKEKTGTLNVSK
ncbi:hypothetical protein GYN24_01030 [Lactococcus piscium]|uniref:EF-hand domain-containing protein n=1 Tax=Pseudolactococcus paracarnosus TaxID=2749962 RepID=A0A7L4WCE9_9LACT|nr:hypothetical protein [Lactococcus paracarnosus]MCJ1993171.1 hypothetical protein [Lactococcus paracarnosus]QDJ27113.1 hypothetical protein BHS01_00315 [Lactococcus paracarnosus]SPC36606.1 hypothetical protein LPICM02_30005 [Lactococcus piscium]